MLGFLSAPVGVAYHIVVALSVILTPLGSGLATAVAIVLFTVGVRLLLSPLSYHAIRGQASLSALQPKITELRKRYQGQPDKLQQELTALYRAEGGGMLAGCLPLLLQLPFFSVMYRLFLSATVSGRPNSLLTRDLLTTPLGSHWLTAPGPVSTQGLLFLGLFALLAGAAFVAARVSRPAGPVLAAADQPDQPAGLGLLSRILPYTTVAIAAFVPLAAGLYLLTTTAWTAAERALLRRWTKQPAP
jgi:YidC/Oxa1 family membrane protein insertase